MDPPEKKKNDQLEPQDIPSKVVAEEAKHPMKQFGSVEQINRMLRRAAGHFQPVGRQVESGTSALKLTIEKKQQQQQHELNSNWFVVEAPQVLNKTKSSTTESQVGVHHKSSQSDWSTGRDFWFEALSSGSASRVWQQERERWLERKRRQLDKVIKHHKTEPKIAPSPVPADPGYVVLVPLGYKLPQKDTMKGPIVFRVLSDTSPFAPDGFVHLYNSHTKTIDLIKVRAKGQMSKTVSRVPADTPKALFNPDLDMHKQLHTETVKTGPTMMQEVEDEDTPTAVLLPDDYVHVFYHKQQVAQLKTVKGAMPKSNEKKKN